LGTKNKSEGLKTCRPCEPDFIHRDLFHRIHFDRSKRTTHDLQGAAARISETSLLTRSSTPASVLITNVYKTFTRTKKLLPRQVSVCCVWASTWSAWAPGRCYSACAGFSYALHPAKSHSKLTMVSYPRFTPADYVRGLQHSSIATSKRGPAVAAAVAAAALRCDSRISLL
jgi:hypothetical protein